MYFINYMSKGGPLVLHHSETEAEDGSKIIENTYVIYTPKIIKFVYHSNPNPTSLVLPNTQTIIHQRNSEIPQQLADSKQSKPNKTKIRIVSRNTTQINSDPHNSQHSSKRSSNHQKKEGIKVYTTSSKSASNQLQIQSQGPFLGCGWCGQTSLQQDQFLAFPSQIRMRTAESRLIQDIKPYRRPLNRKSDEWIIEKEEPIRLNTPEKRRKIFNIVQKSMNLNNSLDNIQRSRSRCSIFSPYLMRSKSQSLDKSFRRRSRIFSSVQKGTCLKESHFQKIKQIQIPLSILDSWKKQRSKLQDFGKDSLSQEHSPK